MTFLLLDTAGAMCVLVLADEHSAHITSVRVFEGKRTLSRRLMGEMDALLCAEGLALEDMTALAVGVGPGSFTGVRVGVATMRTLAQVTGKPLVGVGTLDAYGASWGTGDSETLTVPVLPSRRNEVYVAFYQNGVCVRAPFAAAPDALTAQLEAMPDVIVCGEPSQLPDWRGRTLMQPWTPPDGLARLATARLLARDTDDPLGLLPTYVVPPSISTPKHLPFALPTPPAEAR